MILFISKNDFLNMYDKGLLILSTIVVTPIAIVCKKMYEPSDTPSPEGITVVVNIP